MKQFLACSLLVRFPSSAQEIDAQCAPYFTPFVRLLLVRPMNPEGEVPSATPKRFCSVRGLLGIGTVSVLLGLCSLLYATRSSSREIFQFLAAALVIAGLSTLAKIPRQRRLIREAEAEWMTNRSNQSLQPTAGRSDV